MVVVAVLAVFDVIVVFHCCCRLSGGDGGV